MYYNVIDVVVFFLIYGFGGATLETAFCSITDGRFIARGGFLTNGFCPLYGVCGLIIVQIFTLCEISITNRFLYLLTAVVGSIAAVTALEYLTGFALDRVFHHKLWDYSDNPFNLHGYICLELSILWGIVAIILSSFIHPITEVLVMRAPMPVKYFSIAVVGILLVINASYNLNRLYGIRNLRL